LGVALEHKPKAMKNHINYSVVCFFTNLLLILAIAYGSHAASAGNWSGSGCDTADYQTLLLQTRK
jgi:hypothetical protein